MPQHSESKIIKKNKRSVWYYEKTQNFTEKFWKRARKKVRNAFSRNQTVSALTGSAPNACWPQKSEQKGRNGTLPARTHEPRFNPGGKQVEHYDHLFNLILRRNLPQNRQAEMETNQNNKHNPRGQRASHTQLNMNKKLPSKKEDLDWETELNDLLLPSHPLYTCLSPPSAPAPLSSDLPSFWAHLPRSYLYLQTPTDSSIPSPQTPTLAASFAAARVAPWGRYTTLYLPIGLFLYFSKSSHSCICLHACLPHSPDPCAWVLSLPPIVSQP